MAAILILVLQMRKQKRRDEETLPVFAQLGRGCAKTRSRLSYSRVCWLLLQMPSNAPGTQLARASPLREAHHAAEIIVTSVRRSPRGKRLGELGVWAPEPRSVEPQTSTFNLTGPQFPSPRNGDNTVSNLRSASRGPDLESKAPGRS